jgi:hypothetical protein
MRVELAEFIRRSKPGVFQSAVAWAKYVRLDEACTRKRLQKYSTRGILRFRKGEGRSLEYMVTVARRNQIIADAKKKEPVLNMISREAIKNIIFNKMMGIGHG